MRYFRSGLTIQALCGYYAICLDYSRLQFKVKYFIALVWYFAVKAPIALRMET
jgi:hypothetical protein